MHFVFLSSLQLGTLVALQLIVRRIVRVELLGSLEQWE